MKQVPRSLRLNLRPCAEEDGALLLEHWIHPAVRRFLFDDRVVDYKTVEEIVAASCAAFHKHGYGLWIMHDKTSNEFQGVCGLCETPLALPDLLFSLAPPYWGRGLATESARCVLQFAFETLALPLVMSTVDSPNVASIRVLEKLGMKLREERIINSNSVLHYALGREDYLSSRVTHEV